MTNVFFRGKAFVCMTLGGLVTTSLAAGEQQCETFGKWRFGVGAAFNFGVEARLGARNLPAPRRYSVPGGSTKADAWRRAAAHVYDGGGFISPDSSDNGYATEYWKLPSADYLGDGKFNLGNAYQEVVGSSILDNARDESDPEVQYGISAEISREIWVHDENEERRWGVDFAAAFSYFFQREIYEAHGVRTRTDSVRDGVIRTKVDDPDAMWLYDHDSDLPVRGLYGHGNYNANGLSPALGWDLIGKPFDDGGPTRPVVSTCGYDASGDYQELEMLFMLRPWYEITDRWRVFAEAGVGVSWGRFDTTFRSEGYACDEDFAQWDCYGVAGLGTAIRYKRFDIMVDVMGRFLRDDLEVDGRHVSGSIGRAEWGLRLMIGYSF